MRSFSQVCAELDRRRHITLGFERIEALLTALGRPDLALPHVVQVVGTNGKGTTAIALAAALEEKGHASGAYLSPHVLSYTERVWLRGRRVSEAEFVRGVGAAMEAADDRGIPASQFEVLTAGALKLFADAGLEWVILEAGMGARHDATSVARAEAVVLTNVDLDHTHYLGETVEEIATEKLASLRPGATLLLGTDEPTVLEVAERECRRIGARLVRVGEVDEEQIARFGFVPYAARDVGLGFAAAEVLLDGCLPSEARESAAAAVKDALPGRFEVHEIHGVPVVLDGGHNAAGVRAALAAVESAYGGRPLAVVFGVLRDKDAGSMLTALRGEARVVVLTRPEGERAAEPGLVAREQEQPLDLVGRSTLVVEDPVHAVGAAAGRMAEVGGVVLVTGSLSTIAPVLRWLRET
ncbi:MAG: Mur ligase family protein [Actinomycetota bacterium]|nr:Mur ligase family protein [Actinomycetota bacterium]